MGKPHASTRLTKALTLYRGARSSEDIAAQAGHVLRLIEEAQTEIRVDRQLAILDLRSKGLKWSEIGEVTGVGRARLNQIIHGVTGGAQHHKRPV